MTIPYVAGLPPQCSREKDKAQSLGRLIRTLTGATGSPLEAADCMTFGDGLNDVEMLKVRRQAWCNA